MSSPDYWEWDSGWSDILDGYKAEIRSRILKLTTCHRPANVADVRIERSFSPMKDGWDFDVYVTVDDKRFRMYGFLASDDFYHDRAVDLIMSNFWYFLLYMQSDAWAEWVKERDTK